MSDDTQREREIEAVELVLFDAERNQNKRSHNPDRYWRALAEDCVDAAIEASEVHELAGLPSSRRQRGYEQVSESVIARYKEQRV